MADLPKTGTATVAARAGAAPKAAGSAPKAAAPRKKGPKATTTTSRVATANNPKAAAPRERGLKATTTTTSRAATASTTTPKTAAPRERGRLKATTTSRAGTASTTPKAAAAPPKRGLKGLFRSHKAGKEETKPQSNKNAGAITNKADSNKDPKPVVAAGDAAKAKSVEADKANEKEGMDMKKEEETTVASSDNSTPNLSVEGPKSDETPPVMEDRNVDPSSTEDRDNTRAEARTTEEEPRSLPPPPHGKVARGKSKEAEAVLHEEGQSIKRTSSRAMVGPEGDVETVVTDQKQAKQDPAATSPKRMSNERPIKRSLSKTMATGQQAEVETVVVDCE